MNSEEVYLNIANIMGTLNDAEMQLCASEATNFFFKLEEVPIQKESKKPETPLKSLLRREFVKSIVTLLTSDISKRKKPKNYEAYHDENELQFLGPVQSIGSKVEDA